MAALWCTLCPPMGAPPSGPPQGSQGEGFPIRWSAITAWVSIVVIVGFIGIAVMASILKGQPASDAPSATQPQVPQVPQPPSAHDEMAAYAAAFSKEDSAVQAVAAGFVGNVSSETQFRKALHAMAASITAADQTFTSDVAGNSEAGGTETLISADQDFVNSLLMVADQKSPITRTDLSNLESAMSSWRATRNGFAFGLGVREGILGVTPVP